MSAPHVPRRITPRIRIQRQLALGETYEIECAGFSEAMLAQSFLDDRLATLNDRVLAFNGGLAALPPAQQQFIANLLAGLTGRVPRAPAEAEEEAVRG